MNPDWPIWSSDYAPDGDADLGKVDYTTFSVPDCSCGGILKPDVVFFGENVPKPRVQLAWDMLDEADALLVVGSSLTVWSGYRFVRKAAALGKPVAIVGLGETRGDTEATLLLQARCGRALPELVDRLRGR
jgi:NAD-dependent SIR2 family protein deacetylase